MYGDWIPNRDSESGKAVGRSTCIVEQEREMTYDYSVPIIGMFMESEVTNSHPCLPQLPPLSSTSEVTVVLCAVWNALHSSGTFSSQWVGGPLHCGRKGPR